MKHTFAFIDKLMILLKFIPHSLETEEDKTKARKAITLIEEYTAILRKLVFSHKNKKYLDKLHKTNISKIENWVEQVTVTFKKIDSLLIILDEDTKKLTRILENEPEKWQYAVSRMALGMVMTGLHDEEEDMKRLRNIAIFEIRELEEIIDHKKHAQGLPRWLNFAKLSEEEQMIKHEEFFAELLS